MSVQIGDGYFTNIAAGQYHSVARDINGDVFAWGRNNSGQLGNESTVTSSAPVLTKLPEDAEAVSVAAGEAFSMALTEAGKVYAWGNNSSGQLGNGTTATSSTPVEVVFPGGVSIVQIAAGSSSGYALASDGVVYAWGDNSYGQLGDETTTNALTPVVVSAGEVPGGAVVSQVVAGSFTAYLVTADGAAYGFGQNSDGQIGNGTEADANAPVAVVAGAMPAGVVFTELSAAGSWATGLGSDGVAYAWGSNGRGQLGDDTGEPSSAPVTVLRGVMPAGVTVKSVAAGFEYGMLVGSDALLYAWGDNAYGQLGTGNRTAAYTPVQAAQGVRVSGIFANQIAAGYQSTTILGSDQYAYTWGGNSYGQLGNGGNTRELTAVKTVRVPALVFPAEQTVEGKAGLTVASEAYRSVGLYGTVSYSTASALPGGLSLNAATGVVSGVAPMAANGQTVTVTGIGTRVNTAAASGTVSFDVAVILATLAAGGDFGAALSTDGAALAWGWNTNSQLGDGSTLTSDVPVSVDQGAVPGGVTLLQVSAGVSHTVALGDDGKLYAWGRNEYGQLGDGTTDSSAVPVAVNAPNGITFALVSAGGFHTVALGSDGQLYAWGWGSFGRLGNGSTANSSVPVPISQGEIPAGVAIAAFSAGADHTVAIGSDGIAYSWGYNQYGQLGNDSTATALTPTAVSMPAGVLFTSVAAGESHTLALGDDGNMYAWGENSSGQLGDGTLTDRAVPVQVERGGIPTGVTISVVSAGSANSAAIGSDGRVYAWGSNQAGQLGNGSMVASTAPVQVGVGAVPSGTLLTDVQIGDRFMLATDADRNVFSWGSGAAGRLGNGDTADVTAPVVVATP